MKTTFDVVIVGAGPTGLLMAYELALKKISVVVLEKYLERSPHSKALTIHGMTLNMLDNRGLVSDLLEKGKQIPTGHFALMSHRLDFSKLDMKYPFTLFLPQAQTEAHLEKHVREAGVEVIRGFAVEDCQQTQHEVFVSGRYQEKRVEISASYLVGADGGRSIIRQKTEIPFDGMDADRTAFLGDVVLPRYDTSVMIEVNEKGALMIAPLGDGKHHRVVIIDPLRMQVPQTEEVRLEELKSSMLRVIGDDFGLHSPIWLTRFSNQTKLARHYRQERIFLVGDAAHIHMPAGGQGMNVGLQDAMNLGWKLAAVIKKTVNENILDTYELERRPVGQKLYKNTMAQTVLMSPFDPQVMALREMIDEWVGVPEINQRLAKELSGVGVDYHHDWSETDVWNRCLVVKFVAHLTVTLATGKQVPMSDLLHSGEAIILCQTGTNLPVDSHSPIGPANVVYLQDWSLLPWSDHQAVLIRPDGYWGFFI
jgi:2-polyprenyl-6-methoxyphenol hydroxylase-like FAD-dependent oxidoreductase